MHTFVGRACKGGTSTPSPHPLLPPRPPSPPGMLLGHANGSVELVRGAQSLKGQIILRASLPWREGKEGARERSGNGQMERNSAFLAPPERRWWKLTSPPKALWVGKGDPARHPSPAPAWPLYCPTPRKGHPPPPPPPPPTPPPPSS